MANGKQTAQKTAQETSQETAQRSSESRLSWLVSVVYGPQTNATQHHPLVEPYIRVARQSESSTTIGLQDEAVSKEGVYLEALPSEQYKLVDEGSFNRVRVNGRAVEEHELALHDVVRIGDSLLVVDRSDPSRRGSRRKRTPLLNALHMFESTARFVFEGEEKFFDPESTGVGVIADGFTETRQIAAWIASHWGIEVTRIDPAAEGAAQTVRNTERHAVVLLERVDALDDAALSELSAAIEYRSQIDEAPVVFSCSQDVGDRPLLARLRETAADTLFVVPPLRQRRADILAAIQASVRTLGSADFEIGSLPPDAAEKLLCYGWPGGLGELKRVARRIHKELTDEGKVSRFALPAEIRAVPVAADQDRSRTVNEKTFQAAFNEYDGNMKEIAAHFGYARTYLYRVLRQSNVDVQKIRENYERGRS